jgi:hypothetical protein
VKPVRERSRKSSCEARESLPFTAESSQLAEIRWNDRVQFVTVLATGTKPLLGTALLQGFRLTIEFSADGMVRVEKI